MATLTVTIQEELSLNGVERGGFNSVDYTVTSVDHRVLDITTSEQSIILFDTANYAGTIADGSLEYLRITNLSTTASLYLRLSDSSQEYFISVTPSSSFVLTDDRIDADATGSEETMSLSQIDTIKAKSSTGTVSVEVFAAS